MKSLMTISILTLSLNVFACPEISNIYTCDQSGTSYDTEIITVKSDSNHFKILSGFDKNAALETEMNAQNQTIIGNGRVLYGEPKDLFVNTTCKEDSIEVNSFYQDTKYKLTTNLKITSLEGGKKLKIKQTIDDEGIKFSSLKCSNYKIMTKFEKFKLGLKGSVTGLIMLLTGWNGN